MKFYILIALLIILSACVKQTEVEESAIADIINQNISEEIEETNDTEPSYITYAELQKQRKREALKEVFDFSLLTAVNCDNYYALIENRLIENRRETRELEFELEDEQEKIDAAIARLKQAESSGIESELEEAKEDYDQASHDYYEINDQVNDLEGLERDLTYILDEIKSDCFYLKKRKA